jgi:hypothetical protein
MNEKVTINENGQSRRITKQEAAIKQLANKAASGDKRAIQDMLRFQTMLFPEAPMTSSEPAYSKHPRTQTPPRSRSHSCIFCATRTRPENLNRPVETRTASEPVIPTSVGSLLRR